MNFYTGLLSAIVVSAAFGFLMGSILPLVPAIIISVAGGSLIGGIFAQLVERK